MENATGDHELTKYYRNLIETSASFYNSLTSLIHMKEGRPTIRPKENSHDTRTTKLLKCLASAGITICPNKHHKTSEGMTPNRQAKNVEHFHPNISLQTWDRTKCLNMGTGWGPSPTCTLAEDDLKACVDTLTALTPLSQKLADRCCSYLHPVVPYYDTYHPWTTKNKTWTPNTQVHICTDGSTFPNRPSAAAFVYITEQILTNELWQTQGFYWKLTQNNNYLAEMAAINKSLRSIPTDVHAVIWTDSLGSILSIREFLNGTPNMLRCDARPYLRAIKRIIDLRTENGAMTEIRHVRSHTGERNPESVGNSEADRLAKWEALRALLAKEKISDINLLENELSFIINLIDLTETDEIETKQDDSKGKPKGKKKPASDQTTEVTLRPLHGNIRKTLKTHFRNNQTSTWATRPTRGQLIRDYPTQTLNLIQQTWTSPTSATIQFLIETLNQVDPKNFDDNTPKTMHCTNCSRNQPATTLHRLITCPAITDIWNKADEDIWKELDLNDTLHGITTPRQNENNKLQRKLMNDLTIGHSQFRQITKLITRCDAWNPKKSAQQPKPTTNPPPTKKHQPNPITHNHQPQPSNALAIRKHKKQRTITDLFTRSAQLQGPTQNTAQKDAEHLILNYLKDTEGFPEHPMQWANCESLYRLSTKYLHTENVANSDALNYTGETHWFSKNPTEKALGAHEVSALGDYINGNYTWINLCENTEKYIDDIKIEEVKTNTRIVTLTYNEIDDINMQGMETQTIASFPPFTITVENRMKKPQLTNEVAKKQHFLLKEKALKNATKLAASSLIKAAYQLRNWNKVPIDKINGSLTSHTLFRKHKYTFKKYNLDLFEWREKKRRTTLNNRWAHLIILNSKHTMSIDYRALNEKLIKITPLVILNDLYKQQPQNNQNFGKPSEFTTHTPKTQNHPKTQPGLVPKP